MKIYKLLPALVTTVASAAPWCESPEGCHLATSAELVGYFQGEGLTQSFAEFAFLEEPIYDQVLGVVADLRLLTPGNAVHSGMKYALATSDTAPDGLTSTMTFEVAARGAGYVYSYRFSQLNVVELAGVTLGRPYLPGLVSAAPEPETYALMLLGLAALGLRGRRKCAERVATRLP